MSLNGKNYILESNFFFLKTLFGTLKKTIVLNSNIDNKCFFKLISQKQSIFLELIFLLQNIFDENLFQNKNNLANMTSKNGLEVVYIRFTLI